jgi:hypothetical protein
MILRIHIKNLKFFFLTISSKFLNFQILFLENKNI